MASPPRAPGHRLRRAPALLSLAASAACALVALLAGQPWLERHLLTVDFFLPQPALPAALRLLAALLAALLLALAVRLQRHPPAAGSGGRVLVAVLLSLLAGEGALRWKERHTRADRLMLHQRLGQPDPRLGWRFSPSQTQRVAILGREVEYSFDAAGNRVRSQAELPDPRRPSLLVAGESVAMGHGLQWDETFAALAAARLGLQPVNLGVNGYGVDQAYLKTADVLAGYGDPRALVMVVVPVQLGRNLAGDHPRLALAPDGSLQSVPARGGWLAGLRLRRLWSVLPYRTDAELASTIALTRALLGRLAAQARARGARPLFVVPSAGAQRPLELHPEAWLLRALFGDGALPWVLVDLDAAERLADGHPNARGAARMAAAVAQALRGG